jgi:hypothetical protein
MSYAAMFSAGSALLGGWANRYGMKLDQRLAQAQHTYGQRIQTANNALMDSQASISNALRAASNRTLAAQARAENVIRRINNGRIARQTQENHIAAVENFARGQEAKIDGDIETQISAAEQRGAFAAASALSGTLGATVDGMEDTLNLKINRATEYRERQAGYATYDQLRQLAGIVPNGISSMDVTRSVPMLDHGYTFSQARPLGPAELAQPAIPGNFFTDFTSWSSNNKDGFRQIGDKVDSWFRSPQHPVDYGIYF